MKAFIFIFFIFMATACTKGTGIGSETIVGKWRLVKLEANSADKYDQEVAAITQKLYEEEIFEFTADGLLIYGERSSRYNITFDHLLHIEGGFLMVHNEELLVNIHDNTLTLTETNKNGVKFVETFTKQ